MAAFTRLAVVALTGMSGRLFRQRRRGQPEKPGKRSAREEKTRPAGSAPAAPPPAGAAPAPAAPDTPPPIDHFRQLSPRQSAPLLATVAARSLPVLGLLGLLITVLLAAGALRGELPFVGAVDSANPAWAAVLITISIWAIYFLWKVPQWQAAAWARTGNANPRELFQIENESRGTLGQILSGVAVLTGLIFAWQQLGQTSDNLRVSQEGQITDRFSRAVDQLGSDDLTIRLGGIYALERIARDSPRDYGPVMEVLTAFARQEAPVAGNAALTPVTAAPRVQPDVGAVLKVIGRRTPAQIEVELEEGAGCLDLTGISAVGANLIEANLRNTCWDRSDLRAAQLQRADLTGTTFNSSNLGQQASLSGADASGSSFSNANFAASDLSRADFSEANLQAANLSFGILDGTNLAEANLIQADLQGALLIGADLSGANLLGADFAFASVTRSNLAGAEHLTAEQLAAAGFVSDSTIPESAQATPAP